MPVNPSGLLGTEIRTGSQKEDILLRLKEWNPDRVTDADARRVIGERFSYSYPYTDRRDIPVKVSVSDLKKAEIEEEDGTWEKYTEPDIIPLVPEFMSRLRMKWVIREASRKR